MPLEAIRALRKMRGGSQAHLIEANDGQHYVVKFQNNAQHRRILINELVCSGLLERLGLPVAHGLPILLTPEFCAAHPAADVEIGGESRPPVPVPGWHFASRFPGHPDRTAVFDILPDTLLRTPEWADVFVASLVFDRWIANADSRQMIFHKRPGKGKLKIELIDNGYAFNGPYWELLDAPAQALYHRSVVYQHGQFWSTLNSWQDRILYLDDAAIDAASRPVPGQWFEEDEDAFATLLARLYARRRRIHELVSATVKARPSWFPMP